MFSVKPMVRGYHEYQNAWDEHEILTYEREVGNIHDTFAVAIKKDGRGVFHCWLSLFQQLSLNLHMDPLAMSVTGPRC